jgi:hypothetical protein
VIEGVPRAIITRIEYFFSTENAARVNLETIRREIARNADVYYLDSHGSLVKLLSN